MVLLVEVVLRAAVVIVVIPYDQVVALSAVCECGTIHTSHHIYLHSSMWIPRHVYYYFYNNFCYLVMSSAP